MSREYQAWRQKLLRDRLHLALWIALLFSTTAIIGNLYIILFHSQDFIDDITRLYGDPGLAGRFSDATRVASLLTIFLIGLNSVLQRLSWSRHYSELLFLSLSWSCTLVDPLVGSFFNIPVPPSDTVFLLQAILIPVHWRLHLLAQFLPVSYSFIALPLLGITHIGERAFYDVYRIREIVDLVWICLICNLAIYLYEQLKHSEFESQRQLKIFLHSVSHDLRTPVMGANMVLKHLLKQPEEEVKINRSILERLLEGSDRQLTLINSLLEAHTSEITAPTLSLEPIQLSTLVKSVLSDLNPVLEQNQICVVDRIRENLPWINADANQLWRVYCNLISNAIKHNPHRIHLILDAEIITKQEKKWQAIDELNQQMNFAAMLYCTVQDTGVGIEPSICHQLFELYTRGKRARYMPGIGLGLYLCKQIVTAHGGTIGVKSHPGEGSTFWFTLPVAAIADPA